MTFTSRKIDMKMKVPFRLARRALCSCLCHVLSILIWLTLLQPWPIFDDWKSISESDTHFLNFWPNYHQKLFSNIVFSFPVWSEKRTIFISQIRWKSKSSCWKASSKAQIDCWCCCSLSLFCRFCFWFNKFSIWVWARWAAGRSSFASCLDRMSINLANLGKIKILNDFCSKSRSQGSNQYSKSIFVRQSVDFVAAFASLAHGD